ncbi:MAG: KTSC domain-containing protein [Novosphingobium sp.]|jgi:hypothetical protein|nr:KTSC domain-containing protein [Novosphingobium sp.]
MGKVIPVLGSSLISGIGYDKDTKILTLDFKGKKFEYDGVSESDYNDFMTASSMGKYFHSTFKNKYKGRKAE